jgi:hypothetical protein
MKHSLVVCEWTDAFSSDGWDVLSEVDTNEVICESVGFLLAGFKEGYVVLAQSLNNAEQYCGSLFIPVAMVKRLTVVSSVA